jgi:hypothetical protein
LLLVGNQCQASILHQRATTGQLVGGITGDDYGDKKKAS